jgi:hypothetical protein
MKSLVVNIRTNAINCSDPIYRTWLTEVFLLVQDIVLGASNNACILNATNRLRNSYAG